MFVWQQPFIKIGLNRKSFSFWQREAFQYGLAQALYYCVIVFITVNPGKGSGVVTTPVLFRPVYRFSLQT